MTAGRLGSVFAEARAAGRAAFIPYLTVGDPTPALTLPLCRALVRGGADIIELGVPFSDPLADGPIIQRASQRALACGVGLPACLDLARQARSALAVPLVLFSYYNPILRLGEAAFAEAAASAGLDGVLVTDLPLEEGASLRRLLIERGVDPILLVAPTSGRKRIARAAVEARGFIYFIARTGVTGVRDSLPEGLAAGIAEVREASSLPVAVGFGISTPEQVRAAGELSDGVVVGSALVAEVEAGASEGAHAEVLAGTLPDRIEKAAARLCGRI